MFYIYKIKLKMENSSFKYLIYKEYYNFLYMIFNKLRLMKNSEYNKFILIISIYCFL